MPTGFEHNDPRVTRLLAYIAYEDLHLRTIAIATGDTIEIRCPGDTIMRFWSPVDRAYTKLVTGEHLTIGSTQDLFNWLKNTDGIADIGLVTKGK